MASEELQKKDVRKKDDIFGGTLAQNKQHYILSSSECKNTRQKLDLPSKFTTIW
jgi:hypothetical protein